MSTYLNIMLKRVQCLRGWTRFASKVESMRCSYSTIHFCVCVKRRTMRRRCRFPGSIRSVALTALSWVGCTQSLASNIDLWFNYLHLIDTAACGPMPFGVVWKKKLFRCHPIDGVSYNILHAQKTCNLDPGTEHTRNKIHTPHRTS